jgi:uncharacterized protein YbaP (TraB family)
MGAARHELILMSDRNSLWEVRTSGTTHHLLGVVHFLKAEHYPLAPAIERTFESAEVLVVEADLPSVPAEEMARLAAAKLHYGRGRSLRGGVAARTYELARRKAAEFGLGEDQIESVKPLTLAMILSHLAARQVGFDENLGIDRYFLRRARADGKEVRPLETAEEQFGFIGGVAPAAQEASLLNTLTSFDKVVDTQERVNRAWATGDVGALEALLTGSASRETPEVSEVLIYGRNEAWLPRVEACLSDGRSHLVAVGAAHLVCERGLLRALGDRGYSIRQV